MVYEDVIYFFTNCFSCFFNFFTNKFQTLQTNELQEIAKNITDTIDAQNASLHHSRNLLGFEEEFSETSTLLSPYNCTFIIIQNCTLAALYAGINLTDSLTTTTFPSNVSAIDGDYFLDNSTSEEEQAYDFLVGNIANLTAHGMANWNVSSSAPPGPHLALPPVFFNASSAIELEDGKMVWDIPLDYMTEPPDNFTDFNDTFSTLDTRWSTTDLQNGKVLILVNIVDN